MPVRIAIASGKGGTGKTSIAVNLFQHLNLVVKKKTVLVDCDVEEPNDLIFFPEAIKTNEEVVHQLIPHINTANCSWCRKCVSWCEFNAITVIPPVKYAEVNAALCHSCGACLEACTEDAINEIPRPTGKIISYSLPDGRRITEGRLDVGSAMQTMLIKELKKRLATEQEILIYDAPPGTSCPVVETISGADYVILVTEPTPFGLHDLKLMLALLSEFQKPFGVIINKAGLGSMDMHSFLIENKIEVLGEIPFSAVYASHCAGGNIFDNTPPEITHSYMKILERIEQIINILQYEGDHCIKR